MMKHPTPNEVMLALGETSWKRTVFIAQRLSVAHQPHQNVPSALVLRRLRDLERNGFIATDGYPNGYYGYEWSITNKGEAFLGGLRIARSQGNATK
jgi:DNA-binding HxlR family transcriptional regulator